MNSRQIFTFCAGSTLIYALLEPFRLEIRRHDIFIENLPAEAENLRVLQISDLHSGALQPRFLLQKIIAAAAREKADLIALTGDLVSRRDSYSRFTPMRYRAAPIMDYAREVAREVEKLKPRLGIFAVPGNHDLWNGSFAPISQLLEEASVQILLNRGIQLENGLWIAGLDDLRAGNPDFRVAFAEIAPEISQLVLNHNPRAALLMANRNALILCGHTHAGQVRFGRLEVRKFPVDLGQSFFFDGFYRLGRAQIYVSRGAGCVHFPLRFAARPEIAVFTLKRA
jgi:hypothetical protein